MLTSTVVGAIILDLDALCGAFESITPCTEEPRTNGEASARLRLIYEQRFHVLCSSIQNLRRRFGANNACRKLLVVALGRPQLAQHFIAEVTRIRKSDVMALAESPRWLVNPLLARDITVSENCVLHRYSQRDNWGCNSKSNLGFECESRQLYYAEVEVLHWARTSRHVMVGLAIGQSDLPLANSVCYVGRLHDAGWPTSVSVYLHNSHLYVNNGSATLIEGLPQFGNTSPWNANSGNSLCTVGWAVDYRMGRPGNCYLFINGIPIRNGQGNVLFQTGAARNAYMCASSTNEPASVKLRHYCNIPDFVYSAISTTSRTAFTFQQDFPRPQLWMLPSGLLTGRTNCLSGSGEVAHVLASNGNSWNGAFKSSIPFDPASEQLCYAEADVLAWQEGSRCIMIGLAIGNDEAVITESAGSYVGNLGGSGWPNSFAFYLHNSHLYVATGAATPIQGLPVFAANVSPWNAPPSAEVKCRVGWAVDYRGGRPGNTYLFINRILVTNGDGCLVRQVGRLSKAWLCASAHNTSSVRLQHFGAESMPVPIVDAITSGTSRQLGPTSQPQPHLWRLPSGSLSGRVSCLSSTGEVAHVLASNGNAWNGAFKSSIPFVPASEQLCYAEVDVLAWQEATRYIMVGLAIGDDEEAIAENGGSYIGNLTGNGWPNSFAIYLNNSHLYVATGAATAIQGLPAYAANTSPWHAPPAADVKVRVGWAVDYRCGRPGNAYLFINRILVSNGDGSLLRQVGVRTRSWLCASAHNTASLRLHHFSEVDIPICVAAAIIQCGSRQCFSEARARSHLWRLPSGALAGRVNCLSSDGEIGRVLASNGNAWNGAFKSNIPFIPAAEQLCYAEVDVVSWQEGSRYIMIGLAIGDDESAANESDGSYVGNLNGSGWPNSFAFHLHNSHLYVANGAATPIQGLPVFAANVAPWNAPPSAEVKVRVGWAVDYREGRPGNVYLFINRTLVSNGDGSLLRQAGRTSKAWICASAHNSSSVRLNHFSAKDVPAAVANVVGGTSRFVYREIGPQPHLWRLPSGSLAGRVNCVSTNGEVCHVLATNGNAWNGAFKSAIPFIPSSEQLCYAEVDVLSWQEASRCIMTGLAVGDDDAPISEIGGSYIGNLAGNGWTNNFAFYLHNSHLYVASGAATPIQGLPIFAANVAPWNAAPLPEIKVRVGWAVDYREGRPGNAYLFINRTLVTNGEGSLLRQTGLAARAWLCASAHNSASLRLNHFTTDEIPQEILERIVVIPNLGEVRPLPHQWLLPSGNSAGRISCLSADGEMAHVLASNGNGWNGAFKSNIPFLPASAQLCYAEVDVLSWQEGTRYIMIGLVIGDDDSVVSDIGGSYVGNLVGNGWPNSFAFHLHNSHLYVNNGTATPMQGLPVFATNVAPWNAPPSPELKARVGWAVDYRQGRPGYAYFFLNGTLVRGPLSTGAFALCGGCQRSWMCIYSHGAYSDAHECKFGRPRVCSSKPGVGV
jgi:hypothetical protein